MDAVIPLGLPAIIFGGILGGVVTPTEAAVLAVVYAFIVGVFVYREIKWQRPARASSSHSAVVTATVCFLLGTAAVVAWILAVEQIPQTAAAPHARGARAAISSSSSSLRSSSSSSAPSWRAYPPSSSSCPPSCRWCSGSAST